MLWIYIDLQIQSESKLCFAQFVSSEYFKDNGLNHKK